MEDRPLRVSDAEREQMVLVLRHHLLDGRLTLDEFSERVEVAYRARTNEELVRARSELPDVASQKGAPRRRPVRFTTAFFGHVVRRGRIRLRRWSLAVGIFSDLDLDLREAEIDQPTLVITLLSVFGNADLYVPESVNVDVGGITVVGHRREWGRDLRRPDVPTVRVRVLGWFATVDVWRVPHELRGSYREIFRELHRRQKELPS